MLLFSCLLTSSPIAKAISINIEPLESFDFLSIHLTSFSAFHQDYSIVLKWTVGIGSNGSHFEIEKSSDGHEFSNIGIVIFEENLLKYTYIDYEYSYQLQFYRLKITDVDGQFAYSRIVQVRPPINGQNIQIFPNPNDGYFSLIFPTPHICEEITCELFTGTGQKIKSATYKTPDSAIYFSFQPEIPGFYFLKIYLDNHPMASKRIIIHPSL